MEFVQASFQASFDARVERVDATELAELRTIFWYFDTDGDGAVSSDQACRMFALLGLDVNPAYVKDLEEVYLNEFIKIVDSHVPTPVAVAPAAAAEPGDSHADPFSSASPMIPVLQIVDPAATNQAPPGPHVDPSAVSNNSVENANDTPDGGDPIVLDEDALRRRDEQLWEDEWHLIDSHRRGHVAYDELRLFLLSCGSAIPSRDLLRFVEMYGEPLDVIEETTGEADDGGGDVFVLTKEGFIRFRREYTEKDARGSDQELSSNEEEDDDGDETEGGLVALQDRTARGGNNPSEALSGEAEAAAKQQRRRGAPSEEGDAVELSRSQADGIIIVDPSALDQSDASDLDDDDDDENGATPSQQSGVNLLFSETNADEFADE